MVYGDPHTSREVCASRSTAVKHYIDVDDDDGIRDPHTSREVCGSRSTAVKHYIDVDDDDGIR